MHKACVPAACSDYKRRHRKRRKGAWRKLSVKDSPALPALTQLETMGVSILVCGTCLDYYSLLDKKGIGIITNMLDIVTSLQAADKIINI